MAFSGDSRRLVLGFDQGLIVYDTSDFRQITLKRSDAVKAVTFSPNNQYLVGVENRGQITMWNAATDREVATLFNWRKAESGECFDVQPGWLRAGRVQWRVGSRLEPGLRQEKLVLLGHTGGIPCVAFRGDGEIMATGSKDRQVRLWDPKSGKLAGEHSDCPAPSKPFPFRRIETLAIGYWGDNDRGIQIVDVATRKPLVTERHDLGEVDSLAFFDREGKHFLAASGALGLSLWLVQMDESAPRCR